MSRSHGAAHALGALLCAASCSLGACDRATASPAHDGRAVVSALAAPVLAPVVTVSSAGCEQPGEPERLALEALLDTVNRARARGADCGLRGKQPPAPPLASSIALSCAARSHALDMSTRGFFAHADPEGRRVRDRARSFGYTGQVGENLAWGQSTPAQVVEVWLRSPDHCQNMLRPQLSAAGAGFARSAAGKTFWAQVYGVDAPAEP